MPPPRWLGGATGFLAFIKCTAKQTSLEAHTLGSMYHPVTCSHQSALAVQTSRRGPGPTKLSNSIDTLEMMQLFCISAGSLFRNKNWQPAGIFQFFLSVIGTVAYVVQFIVHCLESKYEVARDSAIQEANGMDDASRIKTTWVGYRFDNTCCWSSWLSIAWKLVTQTAREKCLAKTHFQAKATSGGDITAKCPSLFVHF